MRPRAPIPPDLMSNVHVPAWKRLGLKLKYAKETAEPLPSRPSRVNGHFESPPPAVTSVTAGEPPSKKRRLSPALKQDDPSTSPPPAKPERHVSFSADTKLVDGDTARSTLPSEAQDFLNSPEYLLELQKMEQPKSKPKAPITNGSSTQAGTSTKSSNSLEYLTQYHENHDSWSFNKNREVWILKHALSTTDIPVGYNLSLALYIHGLRAENARSRLATECEKALERLPDSYAASVEKDSGTKCRQELVMRLREDPLSRWPVSDSLKEWLKETPRADLLLTALRPDSPPYIWRQSSQTPSNTAKAIAVEHIANRGELKSTTTAKLPASKKRKLRTTAIDLSSSSSSNSSSSSDEESSALQTKDDETSSSGSDEDSDSDH